MQLKDKLEIKLIYECESIINSTTGTTYILRLTSNIDKTFDKMIRVSDYELPKLQKLTQ